MKRAVVLVACLLVGVGVLITAVDELRSPGTDQNMHVVQAQAFLDGHLDISKDLADVSIYHGKGYSPFPPGPVVVVLPFVAVLGDRVEIAILLGLALWVLSAWFVRRICSNVGVPPVQANLLTAGAVLGTGAWAVATSSSGVWYFSLVVAFTVLLGAIDQALRGRAIAAGLLLGMAFLSRQLTICAAPLLVVLLVQRKTERRLQWRSVLIFAVPVALAIVAYCVYNGARFSGPFDTGYDYIRESDVFLAQRVNQHGLFSLAYVPFNFTYLFIQGFHVQYEGVELLKTAGSDPFGTSLTFASPFLFFAVLARPPRAVLWAATGGLVVCIAAQLTYYNNGWFQTNAQRFTLDFIPVLVLLLAYAIRRTRSGLWKAAIVYAVALNFLALVVYDRLGWLDSLVGAS